MKLITNIIVFIFLAPFSYCQQQQITINANLDTLNNQLQIQQKLVYFNNTTDTLNSIYLHNWANGFKNRKTPLSKRFIKNFNKKLYFANANDLGFSSIKNITENFKTTSFKTLKNQEDILKVLLKKPLQPNQKTTLNLTYVVKLPNASFTEYGVAKNGYRLRYWYITPTVYNTKWQLMSHLDLDDLFENLTTFNITLKTPKNYAVASNLKVSKRGQTTFVLTGKHATDATITIENKNTFKQLRVKQTVVETNLLDNDVEPVTTTLLLNRTNTFLREYFKDSTQRKIFLDKVAYKKNPLYGLNQLPDFIKLYPANFKNELKVFKTFSKQYLKQLFLINERTNYWLIDGLQNYLTIEYISTYYPNIKLLGKASNSWFIKKYNISKLGFNEKYPFVYQFTARRFLDQSLVTQADSLSNFNQKIVSKYKAGLGFNYLKGYIGKKQLGKSIKDLYKNNQFTEITSSTFKQILQQHTSKNINWFFNDYINTNKKIDYTLKEKKDTKDSVTITIKNKRNITVPVALYGIKNDSIVYKKWFSNITDTLSATFAKHKFDTFALNYENIYPELNTADNYYNIEKKIFNKPLKLTLVKDIEAPSYTQLFYQPSARYNFYDGLILNLNVHNKPIIKKNLEFSVTPGYATKSNKINGSFKVELNRFFEKTKLYRLSYGLVGNTFQYAPDLSYSSLIPFLDIEFKRKSLRDATSEFLRAKIVHINKEVAENVVRTDQDRYNVFSLSYNYINPDIISEKRYLLNAEVSKNFSKLSTDIRFRSLTSTNTQLDFRLYVGAFLHNNTNGNFFNFGLDRANDYLFELNYFGRSEASGFFSQQYIITEGGFKSVLPTRFADQFMVSFNSSIGLWRWLEFYNDVALLKNKTQPVYFAYNNGIRFNFVHNILEVYFPLYSNNGWEIGQQRYAEKIRFTLTGDLNRIYNFFRRGFL